MKENKKCSKCGIEKNINEFHKKSESKDGLNTRCKVCISKYHSLYSNSNSVRKKINIPELKVCGKCGENKLSKEFSKNRSKIDGLCGYCKKCDTKKASMLRKKNRNRHADQIKIPNEKICPRCNNLKKSRGFAKNRNRKDGLNPYCKSCTSEIMVVQNAKRRELSLQLDENFTPEDASIVKMACHNQCILCGTFENLSIDHFRPLSKLNVLEIGNAIVLCRSCNSKKHNADPEEFFSEEILKHALVAIAVSDILKNGVG